MRYSAVPYITHPLLRYALTLAGIYLAARFSFVWTAGRCYAVLTLLLHHAPAQNVLEFAFTHMFIICPLIGLLLGLILLIRFPTMRAPWVAAIPITVLAFKFVTAPRASIFENRWTLAWHEYFGTDFFIPWDGSVFDFRALESADFYRAIAQLHY